MKRSKDKKVIVGVDEVGRGPLAGPITLAVFAASKDFKNKLIKILGGKVKDSKRLSPKRREEIYKQLKKLHHKSKNDNGHLCCFFAVSHISNKIIDKKGISYATRLGIKRCLANFTPEFQILLDGGLKAPGKYKNQKTIIKGDEKDVFIACASIVAKVRRDHLMCRLGSKSPLYAFQIHKGYGTALHYKLIKKHGLSEWHRKSFLKNY